LGKTLLKALSLCNTCVTECHVHQQAFRIKKVQVILCGANAIPQCRFAPIPYLGQAYHLTTVYSILHFASIVCKKNSTEPLCTSLIFQNISGHCCNEKTVPQSCSPKRRRQDKKEGTSARKSDAKEPPPVAGGGSFVQGQGRQDPVSS